MVNPVRGEVALEIAGRGCTLKFTLGVLAQLESTFQVESLAELGQRLGRLNASDLIEVLSLLLEAGGHEDARPPASQAPPSQAAKAVAECIKANLE